MKTLAVKTLVMKTLRTKTLALKNHIQNWAAALDLRPLLILAVLYGIVQWLPFDIFGWLQNEDGLMEWASFAALATASANTIRILRRSPRSASYRIGWLVVLLICILFAGEEIAWGERLHGFGLDAIRSINTQDETTLHNIRAFQNNGFLNIGWSIFGLALGAGWIAWPKFSALPAQRLSLYFLIPSLWYAAFQACNHKQDCFVTVANHQEIYEFLIALGIYLHTRSRLKRSRDGDSIQPAAL